MNITYSLISKILKNNIYYYIENHIINLFKTQFLQYNKKYFIKLMIFEIVGYDKYN